MKSFTESVLLSRSGGHNTDIFQSTVMQCLGCDSVIIQRFPPIVFPSSNWARYLSCPYNWHSHDWRTGKIYY